MVARIKLGELLVRAGVVDEYKLNGALSEQRRWGGRLGKILVDMGFVSEDVLIKALSKQLGVGLARLEAPEVPRELLRSIDLDFCRSNSLCPERIDPDRRALRVAMVDPMDLTVVDEVVRRTGMRVEPTLAGERAIAHGLAKLFGAEVSVDGADLEDLIERFDASRMQALPEAMADVSSAMGLPPMVVPQPLATFAGTPESPPVPAGEGPAMEMISALDAAQRKQLKAIRVMAELLIERGLFSREDYILRVGRR